MSIANECVQLPSHAAEECNSVRVKYGGIDALAIIDIGHGITDFENPTQWNTAISDSLVRVITKIKGMIGEPSAVEGENTTGCGSDNVLDAIDITVEWKDFNVSALNDDFYSKLNVQMRNKHLAVRYCEEGEIRVFETEKATFVCLPATAPESNKEKQHYKCKATITLKAGAPFPTLYTEPAGIFE